MSSKPPLSGAFLRQTTDAVGAFLRWLAELIVARNWFSLLILVAIAGLFLFNPNSGLAFKSLNIDLETLPAAYPKGFWFVETGLLVVALAITVRTMPRAIPASDADTADRKAIKGLRPFEASDAEIFSQLQRQRNLRECLDSVTSDRFRFGILHGESGCGKTSFLQAGILPQLPLQITAAKEAAPRSNAVAVYVRFSDQEPVQTIAKALAEQLEIPSAWLVAEPSTAAAQSDDLVTILRKVADNMEQPLILLFDQFEQFFVHYKRKEQRQAFVSELNDWYRCDRLLSVKVVVSIRSDLMYQLDELHQVLRYSLAPQEVFRLEKFVPSEASRVLAVIARTEGLKFNQAFVTELARDELANREDGLISPVDLQILSWMIERQTATELRAFNRSAFEKLGGVEGLLQRFLARSLEARITDSQRQSVMKVLLALTDLERQVRAGMLTAPELKAKLKGSTQPKEVTEAVGWLVRGDVRLVTPQKKNGEVAYELAHEKLIPSLMRQAGKELSAADKASQLMDRRVNEWLGNRLDRRYFFGFRELWLLRQQRLELVWGAKREQKEALLRLSWRRIYGGLSALLLVTVISGGLAGWLNATTAGQIRQMKWQLAELLHRASDATVADAAVAFAKNEQWGRAFELVQRHVMEGRDQESTNKSRDHGLATAITNAAEVLPKMMQASQSQERLKSLMSLTDKIQDDGFKASVLRGIATASVALDESEKAAELLSQALSTAQAVQDDGFKAFVLHDIATAYIDLDESDEAAELLSQSLIAAQTIQDDGFKSSVLRDIAATSVELDGSEKAIKLLNQALNTAQGIQGDEFRSFVLRDVATAYVDLDELEKAIKLLSQALNTVQATQDDRSKASVLRDIATTYMNLDQPDKVVELISQTLSAAQAIQDDRFKASALNDIATAYIELDEPDKAAELLSQAISAAQAIQGDRFKASALSDIATAYIELDEPDKAADLLSQAISAAQVIQDDEFKASTLSNIATAYIELDEPDKAADLLSQSLSAAQAIQDDEFKASALSDIATASVEMGEDTLVLTILSSTLQIAREDNVSQPMITIAAIYAKQQADWLKAVRALQRAREQDKTQGLIQLLTILAEQKNPWLIDGAVVLSAEVEGQSGNYTVKASLNSSDKSCDRRADWWEIITPKRELIARQFISEIHRGSKPFEVIQKGINIKSEQEIIIRVHSKGLENNFRGVVPSGYTDQALQGSIANGFRSVRISENFAKRLAKQGPMPKSDTCSKR